MLLSVPVYCNTPGKIRNKQIFQVSINTKLNVTTLKPSDTQKPTSEKFPPPHKT